MSRMMDNLARILEEENKAPSAQRPPLFVVRESIAPSAQSMATVAGRKRVIAIWGFAFVLIAGLGGALWRDFSGSRQPAAPLPQAPVPGLVENGRGVSLIRAGQFADAEKTLRELLQRQPKLRAARLNHGYAMKAMGKKAEAEREYTAVLRLFPSDPVALNNLGALYLEANRLPEAEAALRKATDNDPNYTDALLNLAAVFESEKDWVQAAGAFERLLQVSAESAADPRIRERVRRVRSLAAAAAGSKEKF